MRRIFIVAASALTTWGLSVVGCSPSQEDSNGLFQGEGTAGGAARDGGSAASGNGASASGGSGASLVGNGNGGDGDGASTGADPDAGAGNAASAGGTTFIPVDFKYTPPVIDTDAACAATTLAAEEIEVVTEVQVPVEVPVEVVVETIVETIVNEPAAIYLMLDKSGSMDDGAVCLVDGGFLQGCQQWGPNKWQNAVSAITTFVNDPNSAGLKVGLQYFELSGGNCSTGAGYDTPAVAPAALPGNATAIINSLGGNSPNGGTPTEGALRGLTQFCKAYEDANGGEKCVGVLITDGEPANCDTNQTNLANIAGNAFTVDGIQTFTLGMDGANFGFLDAVATAGGADCTPNDPATTACNATDSATFTAALQGIVSQIVTQTVVQETITEIQTVYETEYVTETQTQKIPCEYAVPQGDAGALDYDAVEVKFTSGSSSQYIPPAGNVGNCGDGWYYDDVNQPTRILFCPATCTVLSGLPNSSVDIEFRCLGS